MSRQSAPYIMDEMLYLKHVESWPAFGASDLRRINTVLGCIADDTDTAELHVRLLLRGINETVSRSDYNRFRNVQPVGRVEIFGDWHTAAAEGTLKDRGLVLFDINNRPLIHVTEAVIGYAGGGSSLTAAILEELGVGRWIFDGIQFKYREVHNTDTPYYLVIQSVWSEGKILDWRCSPVTKSIWQ